MSLDRHRYNIGTAMSPTEIVAARIEIARREQGWSGEELRSRLGVYLNGSWPWPDALLALSMVFEKPVGYWFEPATPEQCFRFPSGVETRGEVLFGPVMGANVEHVAIGDDGQIEEITLKF